MEKQYINKLFAGTTVDIRQVHQYLRHSTVVKHRSYHSSYVYDELDDIDWQCTVENVAYCEWLIRLYLLGYCQQLCFIIEELDSLVQYGQTYATNLLEDALNKMQQRILNEEWYELMPRFIKVRTLISNKF